jgi:polar amino acid transport system substrate-binding protein
LLAGKCDAYIGLPDSKDFMGPKLIFSKPFLNVGYALVTNGATHAASLADLEGKRVAVQFASSPQVILADHEEIKTATYMDPESAMSALATGKVDAAIIWGPTAGYLNKTAYRDTFAIVPVAGEGMQWPVSIGFSRDHADLRDKIDSVIESSHDIVAGLAIKYGFPVEEPVSLIDMSGREAQASHEITQAKQLISLAGIETSVADKASQPVPAPQSPPAVKVTEEVQTSALTSSATDVASGHEIFNGTCSHCHGPDAIQSERRINLRLLKHRYGDKMDQIFHDTVTRGRPEKGMPNWSGVFSEEDFSKILAYLHTVQQD